MPHAGGPANDLESSSDARPLQLEGSFLLAAGERGWTIVAERADNDLSSFTGRRRPGFEAMVKAMDEEAEIVIAWPLERLQRNRHDELKLHEVYKTWRAHRLRLLPGGSAVGSLCTCQTLPSNGSAGVFSPVNTRYASRRQINPDREDSFDQPSAKVLLWRAISLVSSSRPSAARIDGSRAGSRVTARNTGRR
jgi:hypothetical protein